MDFELENEDATIAFFMMKFASSFDSLRDNLKQVQRVLEEETHASDLLTRRVSRDLLAGRGKGVRPALLLMMYQTVKRSNTLPRSLIRLAAMIEMIHSASVVHDDIIDESVLRRGQKALHVKWGTKMSILMGDLLYARSAMLIASDGNMDVLEVVSRSVSDMCRGQMKELNNVFNWNLSERHYVDIIRDKTGVLFSAACEVGAIMAGATTAGRRAASQYGMHIGLAFQIMDDVLDLTGSDGVLGKPVGLDLREGRITLPVILAMRKAAPKDRKIFKGTLHAKGKKLSEVGEKLAHQYGGVESARNHIKEYAASARESLEALDPSSGRMALEMVARMAGERTN